MAKKISSARRPKKAVKKSPARKKTAAPQRKAKPSVADSTKATYWKAYHELQARVDDAWQKLQLDVKRKAPPEVLLRHKNALLLLLGECNYMARECMRMSSKK